MCASCFPHPKTIFGPAPRHWQRRNNYTPLHPIYINKRSRGDREREEMRTVMVKIIFQATARHVLKHVYGCVHVLHCRWNIWFSLAEQRLMTHSAGLIQSVYPIVTLTIHLWATALQHQQHNWLSLESIIITWSIWSASRNRPNLPCDDCLKHMTGPKGFNACDVDPALPCLERTVYSL